MVKVIAGGITVAVILAVCTPVCAQIEARRETPVRRPGPVRPKPEPETVKPRPHGLRPGEPWDPPKLPKPGGWDFHPHLRDGKVPLNGRTGQTPAYDVEAKQSFEERAYRVLPANTSDPSKTAIYIERTARGFYFQSNFIAPGFESPTKIANQNISDVKRATLNMLLGREPNGLEQQVADIYRKNVQILLDRSAFSEGGYPDVDLDDAENVAVVDGATGEILTNASVERLDRTSPPPILLSKVHGCCLYGIPPHLAPTYQKALEQRPFDKGNVRFLSLVRDSGTEMAIRRSSELNSMRLGESGRDIESLAQIERAFQTARGKTVIMLSHVEKADFVVRDPAQNVVLSISIDSVRRVAKQYQIELVDLGCQTAQQIEADSLRLGVMTKFNTVTAVKSLEGAISRSQNYSEFFDNLTSEKLKIVVDAGFMQGWPLCADVYANAAPAWLRPVWVKLARIFVSFRDKRLGAQTWG